MNFVTATWQLKMDIATLTDFLCIFHRYNVLNSEFAHFNPFMPNGISQRYQLEQSISVLRNVRWYISFFFKF